MINSTKSSPPQQQQQQQPPSTIFVHVDAGHIFQVHVGDKIREILGPATVKIVNNDASQPVPLQLTAPPAPGQLVQQIVDENGMLVHLIIKSQTTSPQTTNNGGDLANKSVIDVTSPITNGGSKSIMAAATTAAGSQVKSTNNHSFLPKVEFNIRFCGG